MSASLTCVFGGIGTAPQTPLPPFFTFSNSLSGALASPLYLAATSLYAGPTTFLSIAWQAVQPDFFNRSSPASALAPPATTRPATARARADIFMKSPLALIGTGGNGTGTSWCPAKVSRAPVG